MALSQPHADYTSALVSGVKEDYLVKLNWYDTDGPATGTVGLSMSTGAIINSVYYTPCILKPPVIRESIDLKGYTSTFGNVSIECSDFPSSLSSFPLGNGAGLFSGEFHSNSANRFYMNRTVEIYSMLNDSEDEAKCLKIFSGRLTRADVNSMNKTVRLEATAYNPFDHIEVPTARDTDSNVPAPITYGAYVPNTYGAYATSKTLWACPIIDKAKQHFVRALLRDTAISADAYPHIYDEVLDQFIPVAISSGGSVDSASEVYNGVAISYADFGLYRSAKQKPVGYSSDSGSGWTNTDNAFNNSSADDTSNFATSQQATIAISGGGTPDTADNNDAGVFDLPQYSGRPTTYTIVVAYKLHATISDAVSWGGDAIVRLNARVDDNDFSDSDSNSLWNKTTNQLEVTQAGSGDHTGVSGSIITQTYTVAVATLDGFPKQLALRTESLLEEHSGTGTFLHYASIYDIRISCVQSVDFSQSNNNLQSGMRELLGIEKLYCGADGYTQSWATSTAITTIVDMHRDLIYRFGGITATPTNWATLDSARSNRTVNFSTHKPTSLQELMNLLQQEGNFIFRVDCTGANKYIDPHATRDVTALATGDLVFTATNINNWKFSLTPMSDVLTKYNAFYNMHPGTGDFINTTTTTNTTPRTNYNLGNQTNENVMDKEFHVLNSSTGVAEWVTNKFAFYGEVGLKCEFDVLDPGKYYMEVGDFFKFDSSIGYAFGKNVVDEIWICTKLTRTVGKLKVSGFYLGAEA